MAAKNKPNWLGTYRSIRKKFMTSKKPIRKKCLYTAPRYWYHISSTLHRKTEYLIPRDNDKCFNRSSTEPHIKRTCVAPSVEHCLTAVPYVPGDKFTIYRTLQRCRATKPDGIYDAHITNEGWLMEPALFVKVGTLTLADVAAEHGLYIIEESASSSRPSQCGRVLKWWQRQHLQRFIKPS